MSRTYDIYLQDIIEAIDRIESYVKNTTRSQFETDQMRFDAVVETLKLSVKRSKESRTQFEKTTQVLLGER